MHPDPVQVKALNFLNSGIDGPIPTLCRHFSKKFIARPFEVYSPMKNVKIRAYSEPLIREIAEKQIRWVIDNS